VIENLAFYIKTLNNTIISCTKILCVDNFTNLQIRYSKNFSFFLKVSLDEWVKPDLQVDRDFPEYLAIRVSLVLNQTFNRFCNNFS
jgi:hypothetical protein